jgi:hypothetical protein
MQELALRKVLLVQAIEETDRSGEALPLPERTEATRSVMGNNPPNIETQAGAPLSSATEWFLVRRAELLLDALRTRSPGIDRVLAVAGGATSLDRGMLVLAFAVGAILAFSEGVRGGINIFAPPLLLLLAWNVLVYVLRGVSFSKSRIETTAFGGGSAAPGVGVPGPGSATTGVGVATGGAATPGVGVPGARSTTTGAGVPGAGSRTTDGDGPDAGSTMTGGGGPDAGSTMTGAGGPDAGSTMTGAGVPGAGSTTTGAGVPSAGSPTTGWGIPSGGSTPMAQGAPSGGSTTTGQGGPSGGSNITGGGGAAPNAGSTVTGAPNGSSAARGMRAPSAISAAPVGLAAVGSGTGAAGASLLQPSLFGRFYARWVQRQIDALLGHSTRFNAPLTPGLSRFATDWLDFAQPLLFARARRLLHLSAAFAALGLVAAYYFRGFVLRSAAGWEGGGAIGRETAHALLTVLYGPASLLSGIAIPGADDLEKLRWSAPSLSGVGAPAIWLHLIALTAALYIILPRLILVFMSSFRLWRLSRRLLLPPNVVGYVRTLVAAARSGT